MNKPNSIKKILFQFILISITLPLIVLGFIEIIISSKVLSNEISKSETAYVNVMVETLAHYLIHPKTEVNEIINLLESEIYIGNDHDLEKMAKLIIKIYPQIRNVQITSKDGIVTEIFPYDETFIGLDVSGYGYYKEAVKRNNEYWSASYLSPVYKEPIVSLCIPYTNGYLILNMTLYDIDIFLGSFFDEKQSLLYSITDQNAVYISHMDKNKVLLRENNNSFNNNFSIWNGGVIQEKVKYDNIEYYSYSQFIPSLNWMVTLYKPTSIIKRSLFFMIFLLVLVTFIILSIGIYSGQVISRKIIQPLLSLLDATKIISSGEYHTRIPEFDILEFSELAGSFNAMSESIMVSHSGLESEVEKRTKELEKSQKQ
ncbi:MAG: HAMP domain-containing protein, partial [Spirochaetales bacterium]|nr:HAMP domain-containing protein [Spirochaetales bacterium]